VSLACSDSSSLIAIPGIGTSGPSEWTATDGSNWLWSAGYTFKPGLAVFAFDHRLGADVVLTSNLIDEIGLQILPAIQDLVQVENVGQPISSMSCCTPFD
jgi:hypothetical protein